MVLQILRALFILLMAAVGWFYVQSASQPFGAWNWMVTAIAVSIGALLVCVDILAPRKKLFLLSGTFLGIIIGISVAYGLSFVVQLFDDRIEQMLDTRDTGGIYANALDSKQHQIARTERVEAIDLMMGVVCCYLSISFILQTRDDFRFIIPYVEFSKQTKGARPILLDTSVLIDGRITDIAKTGIFESQIIVPRFVLNELQTIADSGDPLKRGRGRRGLDALAELRAVRRAEVILYEAAPRGAAEVADDVDHQLMDLSKMLNARVLTNDFNLNKVAELRGVDVININELANAVKPVVLPGEKMHVRIQKPGKESGQGIGYLEDGTIVVVEQGRGFMNEDVELMVTNMRQTVAGRMIFGRVVAHSRAEVTASDVPGGPITPANPGVGRSRTHHRRSELDA